jgi:hypothetical protein
LIGRQRIYDIDAVREEVSEAIEKGIVGRARAKKKQK